MLVIVKMIERINSFLLLTMFGATCYAYYRVKKIFYLISIVMDSEILDQLTNLGIEMLILNSPNQKEVAEKKLTLK